jgi:hypothetical protein
MDKTDRAAVANAAQRVLEGIARWASDLFDAEAGERLLNPLGSGGVPGTLRDPDLHKIIPLVRALYHFAWEGLWYSDEAALLDALHESGPLNELLAAHLILADGTEIITDEDRASLQTMITAAVARYTLLEGDDLSIDQLAALARVAEKTVRMAANPKLENSLKTDAGPANRTYVKAEAALEWLRRRKDFRETRLDANVDGQPAIRSPEDLAHVCSLFRKNADLSVAQLRKQLGWSARETLAYQNMESGQLDEKSNAFSPTSLVALASTLAIPDARRFAQDAIQVIVTAQAKAEIVRRLEELEAT